MYQMLQVSGTKCWLRENHIIVHVFDSVMCRKVFVARSSFIIRGMGTILGKQIRTASRWTKQAVIALNDVSGSETIAAIGSTKLGANQ